MEAGVMAAVQTNYRFLGTAALVFLASAAATVAWCGSMSGMGGMPMPGGWTMSMAWMRMPGQTWAGAAGSFLAMWMVMMLAMMLPAVTPALLRYRRALVSEPRTRRVTRVLLAASGYFSVWLLSGALLYPAGVALAQLAMQSPAIARAIPLAAGVFALAAGVMQLSAWKSRQLACCRKAPAARGGPPAATPGHAWQLGLLLGVRCSYCCAPLMALLLVFGIMDLATMAAVTAAVCLERLLPRGELLARLSGLAIAVTGMAIVLGRV